MIDVQNELKVLWNWCDSRKDENATQIQELKNEIIRLKLEQMKDDILMEWFLKESKQTVNLSRF